jgi:hypothetical protein
MKWMNTEKIEDEHRIYWEKRNDELRNPGIKTIGLELGVRS